MGGSSEDAIRERAYQIWEREGRPHGRDFEHWVMAQVEIATQRANGSAATVATRERGAAAPKAKSTAPAKPAAVSTRAGRNKRSA